MKIKTIVPAIALLLAFIYLFILQIDAIWNFTIDDMYITLRYAKHWATQGQLLWNMGEPPVEGYSNFTFLVLAATVIQWGGDPVFVLKLVGVLGLLFTTLAVYLLSRFWFGRGLSLIPCVWLLLYRGQIIWAVGGLETTTYQALLAFGLYFLLRAQGYNAALKGLRQTQSIAAILAALLYTLASMTRPEAPALIMLFYALACCDSLSKQRSALLVVILSAVVYAASFLPYFIWRWQYYGLLFPNTVYCKGGSSEWFILDRLYLLFAWPFLLMAAYATFKKRHTFLPWYFLLPSAVYFLLLVRANSVVAFSNRFFLPAFALLLPLSLQGIRELVCCFLQKADESVHRLTLMIMSSLMAFFFIPTMSLSQLKYFAKNPVAGEKLRGKVLEWLNTHVAKNSKVVLGDSGFIPYKSTLHFIDSYCLNNKAMILQPELKRDQWFCKTILRQKPEVVILASLFENNKITYMPVDQCLQKELKKSSNYSLRALFYSASGKSAYRYQIFQLSDAH